MFRKILVANRGEIAVRIMRTCREMGIGTVAIFSEADRGAFHVRYADEAYCVGPPPSSESYLRIETILDVAKRAGAEAIHPGYGFLSENARFAQRCHEAGIVFIGPSPESIRQMGDKITARQTVMPAGVPVVPGTEDALPDEETFRREAERIGFPIMLKAKAGGGGKGMRLVRSADEISSAWRAARSEAKSSFGDDSVYIEKYILSPRHVEIQVLADTHGNTVHLFERECSVQRRHQKVIEETPSRAIDERVRQAMGEVAVKAAIATNYVGAGTVEFIVDAEMNYYFLEMNTRLQVEHPITELITGIDLVRKQIEIAAGHPLRLTQKDIRRHGAAIECRIYAEDPEANFMPSPGKIGWLRPPAGFGIREDSGVDAFSEIPIHYDPMISKLCAWGATREEAIARMDRALSEYQIEGIRTNIAFHRWVMRNPAFREGRYDTHFIDNEFEPEVLKSAPPAEMREAILAAAAAVAGEERPAQQRGESGTQGLSPWRFAHRASMLRRF